MQLGHLIRHRIVTLNRVRYVLDVQDCDICNCHKTLRLYEQYRWVVPGDIWYVRDTARSHHVAEVVHYACFCNKLKRIPKHSFWLVPAWSRSDELRFDYCGQLLLLQLTQQIRFFLFPPFCCDPE